MNILYIIISVVILLIALAFLGLSIGFLVTVIKDIKRKD